MSEIIEPTTIANRFQRGPLLGRGGMATVYRAYDTLTERDVAIKILHDYARHHPFIVARFKQEVAIAQGLHHPNIVRIHSLIDTPDMLGLVMDLHGSSDLKAHLLRHGKMDCEQVVSIATQVLSALEMAHAQGIVHQDIKPHNILWDEHTHVAKLIDFGLAELDEAIALARPESAMGTVEYSAPEQFDDFAIDARADLYSLSITLFELLTLTLPYRSETAAGVIQMHREAPVPDVRIFARDIPAHVANALMRAAAKSPEDRFENATEMRRAISGEKHRALTKPHSTDAWETLKSQQDTDLNPPNWNVFLSAPVFAKYVGQDPRNQLTQGAFLRDFFRQHHRNYKGDYLVRANTGGTTFYEIFSKDRKNPSNLVNELDPDNNPVIPLACCLNATDAKRIRHQLATAGLSTTCFQATLKPPTPDPTAIRKPSGRLRKELKTTAKILGFVSAFAIMFFGAVGEYTPDNPGFLFPLIVMAYIALWAASFIFFYGEPLPERKLLDQLGYTDNYLLQFNLDKSTKPQNHITQKEHAQTYHQLQSHRVRDTYERIILKTFALERLSIRAPQLTAILDQATNVCDRIIELENNLRLQNPATIFQQLARIDAQIAQTHDTETTADFIQQKVILSHQLNDLDTNRRELANLNQELLTVAATLESL